MGTLNFHPGVSFCTAAIPGIWSAFVSSTCKLEINTYSMVFSIFQHMFIKSNSFRVYI